MWSNRRTRLALWKVHPMRKLLLTLADDVTETSCGSCDYASLMPCTEPTIYICTRPEFATRDASGKYETAERPGRTRLPACIAAEQQAARLVDIAPESARDAVNAGGFTDPECVMDEWKPVLSALAEHAKKARG